MLMPPLLPHDIFAMLDTLMPRYAAIIDKLRDAAATYAIIIFADTPHTLTLPCRCRRLMFHAIRFCFELIRR